MFVSGFNVFSNRGVRKELVRRDTMPTFWEMGGRDPSIPRAHPITVGKTTAAFKRLVRARRKAR